MASRFADINAVQQLIEDKENENTKKKTPRKRKPKFIGMGFVIFFLVMKYFKSAVSPF